MILTYGQIHCGYRGANMLMGGKREIPMTAKFKIARLHDALEKAFTPIEEHRIELVQKYGSEQFTDEANTISVGWQLGENTPAYKEFAKEWEAYCEQTQEVNVAPITLTSFGDGEKGLEALEFKLLGPLVVE